MVKTCNNEACPLCQETAVCVVDKDPRRDYLFCRNCKLIFVPSVYFLSPQAEKERYDLHVNGPEDIGYRRFLGRLFHPMEKILSPDSHGLDFGSGPGPTLSVMFEEAGHSVAVYDRFYAPDPQVFHRQYDFITATEVLEHLQNPRDELNRLWRCLKPGGWFGVMTQLALGPERFSRWHYKQDPTHLRFFSRATVRWMADLWDAALRFVAHDAFLFHKPSRTQG